MAATLRSCLILTLALGAAAPLHADDPPREPGKGEAGKREGEGQAGKREGDAGKREGGEREGDAGKREGQAGKDDGADAARGRPGEARAYAERLLAATRRRVVIGGLTVELRVVPDHFVLLAAREVAASDPTRSVESLRAQLLRLAEQRKRSVQRAGLLLSFARNDEAPERGFMGFEGQLHEHVKASAAGSLPLAPLVQDGPLEQRELMLFKPQRSALFAGQNAPPTLRRTYTAFGGKAVTLELVARKPLPEKATELKVGLAGFIRFSGVREGQIDFEKGGAAEVEAAALETFALPLQGLPELPASLAELLPAAEPEK